MVIHRFCCITEVFIAGGQIIIRMINLRCDHQHYSISYLYAHLCRLAIVGMLGIAFYVPIASISFGMTQVIQNFAPAGKKTTVKVF